MFVRVVAHLLRIDYNHSQYNGKALQVNLSNESCNNR